MLTAVTGINWGDEGKGRVIDLLAEHADIVARYQGGNNAGHTVVTEQGKFILNLLPSGILHPDVTCVLGAGMVIDLDHLAGEMDAIEGRGITVGPENLKLSDKATISMPWHKVQDGLEEDRLAKKGSAFGSTRRGIAYAYSDKYRKKTLRLGDLLHLDEKRVQDRLHMILESKNLELAGCYHQEPMSYDALLEWCRVQAGQFAPYICDVGAFLQQAHDSGKRIVLEAQLGAMRDIDYGIFPFTSSSNTLAAYAPLGAGIPNCRLDTFLSIPNNTAATAVTCGAAILVPSAAVNPPNGPTTFIISPGAINSISLPITLLLLTSPLEFTPPTAITSLNAAGYSILIPVFPAEATNIIFSAYASLIAFSNASEYTVVPKLKFIISTSCSIAQYIPSITLLIGATLLSSKTLAEYNSTFGFIPSTLFSPLEPAIIPATLVPCPE